MNSYVYKHHGDKTILFNQSLYSDFPFELFDEQYLKSDSSFKIREIQSKHLLGRSRACLFEFEKNKLVLRHYYRGGLVSKFNEDIYIWQGIERTRSVREYKMLHTMRHLELPVPAPIAANIHRKGIFYKADLITKYISASLPLSSILKSQGISNETWKKIGSVIKLFHKNCCNHVDLNAHNILIDDKYNIYLIDFDKSKIESGSGVWEKNNITRLNRSLKKLSSTQEKFYFTNKDFEHLLDGYKR